MIEKMRQRPSQRKEYYEFYTTNTMVCIPILCNYLWTSILVFIMNGHLTFLEWTVIMAVLIYLTTEVIVWIKYIM